MLYLYKRTLTGNGITSSISLRLSALGSRHVGWLLNEERGGVIFDTPARVRSAEPSRRHAKSASRCPAILGLESRYFEVKYPFDLHLAFARDKEGKPGLRNRLGTRTPVRPTKIASLVHVANEAEWRHPRRPTIQLSLPYVFVADEPVYLSQVAPFMHYRDEPWPGTIFGGRFPIDIWPRPLMWAFEWHDTERERKLARSEPLFYCQFETAPQDRPVRLIEAERTAELSRYLEYISGVVNFVNQSFSLFRTAEERRPKTPVVPEKR
ncbi:MAG: hypothetical protein OYG32_13210 [Rhodospirillaceae bacterium]|nr:hypothetical protein [Rhodospirillaceae bacterium]